jgi:ADP-sugar diphosphatase
MKNIKTNYDIPTKMTTQIMNNMNNMNNIITALMTLITTVITTILRIMSRPPNVSSQSSELIPNYDVPNYDIPNSEIYEYRGIRVIAKHPHIEKSLPNIVKSPKFRKWIDNFDTSTIGLTEITITDVDFFGPKLGFIKFTGNAVDKQTNKKLASNIAFVRGGSIAVLIVVTIDEDPLNKKIILCRQLRFPVGGYLTEACAGMLDDGEVMGAVFNELKEEAGIIVKEHELQSFGQMIPSGGGCDEEISLFVCNKTMSMCEYLEKQHTIFGDSEESIQLKSYDYNTFDEILDVIKDAKAECIWRRYQSYLKKHA